MKRQSPSWKVNQRSFRSRSTEYVNQVMRSFKVIIRMSWKVIGVLTSLLKDGTQIIFRDETITINVHHLECLQGQGQKQGQITVSRKWRSHENLPREPSSRSRNVRNVVSLGGAPYVELFFNRISLVFCLTPRFVTSKW